MQLTAFGIFLGLLLLKVLTLSKVFEKFLLWVFSDDGKVSEKKMRLAAMEKEAERLNTPSTFVEHAKLKRKIAAMKKQMPQVSMSGPSFMTLQLFSMLNGLAEYILLGCLYWVWWSTPVVCVPFIPPTARMADFSGADDNCLGIIPWTLMVSSCIGRFVELLTHKVKK